MIRGLYIATTGMLTSQHRMDVVTNNLANAGTPGFKEDNLLTRSFEDLLIDRLEDPAIVGRSNDVGPLNTGVHIDEIATSFVTGALQETGLHTDLAIQGEGFFAVKTPDGERYTRSGQFCLSADGTLTTAEGYPVLGQAGPIWVGDGNFTVDNTGTIRTSGGKTNQLRLVSFSDLQGLRKEGGSLYGNYNAKLTENAATSVRQGCLEGSNVDLTRQMVNMVDIARDFELNQRVIKMMDERLGKAVNDIGRL